MPSASALNRATGSPLLDQLWQAARQRGDSQPTAEELVDWARRFILFHNKRHPSQPGLREAVHCHTFRHSFATYPVERGVNIRSVQLPLGHESLETTMIYTHVARKGVTGVTSPLDLLDDLK